MKFSLSALQLIFSMTEASQLMNLLYPSFPSTCCRAYNRASYKGFYNDFCSGPGQSIDHEMDTIGFTVKSLKCGFEASAALCLDQDAQGSCTDVKYIAAGRGIENYDEESQDLIESINVTGYGLMMAEIVVYDEPDCRDDSELSDMVYIDLPYGVDHLLEGKLIKSIKVDEGVDVHLYSEKNNGGQEKHIEA